MNRKDRLRAALGARVDRAELPGGNSAQADVPPPAAMGAGQPLDATGVTPAPARPEAAGEAAVALRSPLVRSGAVGAMGRSLGRIAHAAEEARALVAAGDRVVEIDPALVDASFVTDRLDPASDADHTALVALIRDSGQQVPILVRPHPDHPSRYQVAYGHRRLRAAAALGRPVRAVVKALNDEDLVVAQGQENSARTDLSYIERALFAVALEDRGFERALIMTALNLEKTQLSRFISIGRAVPPSLVAAVGPAPKAGRPRWAALIEGLARPDASKVVDRVCASTGFADMPSDDRFSRVLAALLAPPARSGRDRTTGGVATVLKNAAGRPVVRSGRSKGQVHLTVDEAIEPSFGAYLIDALPDLYDAFNVRKSERDPG